MNSIKRSKDKSQEDKRRERREREGDMWRSQGNLEVGPSRGLAFYEVGLLQQNFSSMPIFGQRGSNLGDRFNLNCLSKEDTYTLNDLICLSLHIYFKGVGAEPDRTEPNGLMDTDYGPHQHIAGTSRERFCVVRRG